MGSKLIISSVINLNFLTLSHCNSLGSDKFNLGFNSIFFLRRCFLRDIFTNFMDPKANYLILQIHKFTILFSVQPIPHRKVLGQRAKKEFKKIIWFIQQTYFDEFSKNFIDLTNFSG